MNIIPEILFNNIERIGIPGLILILLFYQILPIFRDLPILIQKIMNLLEVLSQETLSLKTDFGLKIDNLEREVHDIVKVYSHSMDSIDHYESLQEQLDEINTTLIKMKYHIQKCKNNGGDFDDEKQD